jgi:catecholate siderophore receptor
MVLRRSLQPLAVAIRRGLVGAGAGLLVPAVLAQPAPAARDIDEVVVIEDAPDRYRVEDNTLSKLTESIRDTPQSIATLSKELLDDRGVTSLNDALRNAPGITLGAGEFSWQGNNPSIRGFTARDDMFLDGLRDFGSYPRDPFNLESVEILLGPSSILFGRGSTGGAINQVSKQPSLAARTALAVNVGSDDTVRATADIDRPVALLGDAAAFRLNGLAHRGEVADRNGARTERFGLAPSVSFGIGGDTQVNVGYMKQTSDDRPDYGLPWFGTRPAPAPRDRFYGFDSDYLDTDADILSTQVLHRVSDSVRLDIQTRYADYHRENRITEPLITPVPPAGTPPEQISVFRYVFAGTSDETLLSSQAVARLDLGTGRVEHALVTGVELGRETSAPLFAFGIGVPGTSLLNPDSSQPFSAASLDPRIVADTEATTLALFALDTLQLSDAWAVTLGLRWDRFDTDYVAERFAGPPTPFNPGTASGREAFAQVDETTSYRAALVYKPVERASVYLAASTAFNPSSQSLSFLTTGRSLGTENTALDPEENRSVELGFKADVAADRLSLSTALFEITKSNARVPDPLNPGFNTLGGEQRIRGVSVDIVGMATERLYLATGYAYLDGEVVRGAAGAATGAKLANAPEHSFSFWANYRVASRFDVGLGARYVSEQLAQSVVNARTTPSYRTVDAMARYTMSDSLALKVNVVNLTDEYYFEQLHPWHIVPAPGRTVTFAVNAAY